MSTDRHAAAVSCTPPTMDPTFCNVGSHLPRVAAQRGDQLAIVIPNRNGTDRARSGVPAALTFAELEALSNRYAHGLSRGGIERGMRVLVMVRPGIDFVATIFALFKIGAPPVMIDPGMGIRRLLDCVRDVDVDALVGIPRAHLLRRLRSASFRAVQRFITVGSKLGWGGRTLHALSEDAPEQFKPVATSRRETAAILFTSGSTGPAKGVVYQHGMFDAQIRIIRDGYGIEPGEIDLPTFPLFVLFSVAMGMTAVIPRMDPSRPAKADPAGMVRTIHRYGVTTTFGSPALWGNVSGHCVRHGIELPSLRRVLIAGAPVPAGVVAELHQVMSDTAEVHTPYGATESMPVCSISGRELLGGPSDRTAGGAGTCVGKPLPGIDLRLISIHDDPISRWSDDLLVPPGDIGEIVVRGAVVTEEYYGLPEATRLAKIPDGEHVRHRIGDVGYLDREGRLWFCGRKSQRVRTARQTLFTDQCEPVFNQHPSVQRSALVGVGPTGAQEPVIVVERAAHPRERGRAPHDGTLRDELRAIAKGHTTTAPINRFLFHRRLPVDVRHNAKIKRELLSKWAETKIP